MIQVQAVDGEGLQGNCKYGIIEHADFQNGFRQVETTHAWTSNLVAFCSALHYKGEEKLKIAVIVTHAITGSSWSEG
jgi:hypothetical protein